MSNDQDPIGPRLADAIAGLRDRPPTRDLWPEIAPRLSHKLPPGTFVMRWPVALAAGIAVALVSAGGTVLAVRAHSSNPTAAALAKASTPADSALLVEIASLEKQLAATSAKLDSKTRVSVKQSLAALDEAIKGVEQARAAHPESTEMSLYLTSTLRQKLEYLKQFVTLTASAS